MTDLPAVTLTENERAMLAMRIALRHLQEPWVEWEDYPMLSYDGLVLLEEAVEKYVKGQFRVLGVMEVSQGIDTQFLLEKVRG